MNAIFPLVLLVISTASAVTKADQVDNPQFIAWSKCTIGSSATYSERDVQGGNKMSAEISETLEEKTKDHLVLQCVISPSFSVMSITNRRTVPAKREKLRDEKFKMLPDEQIQVGDQKITCKVTEYSATIDGHATRSKEWTSDAVPGGVVKTQSTTKTDTGEDTSVVELKSFEKK